MSDLMLYSRIEAQALRAGARVQRVDTAHDLGAEEGFDLVLVDWSARAAGWEEVLSRLATAGARVILVGRHTDLEAHAAARAASLGPMWARSRLVTQLPTLLPTSR